MVSDQVDWSLHVGDVPPILLVATNFSEELVRLNIKHTKIQLRSNAFNSYANGFAMVHFANEHDMVEGKQQIEHAKLLGQHTVQVNVSLKYMIDPACTKSTHSGIIQQHLMATSHPRHRRSGSSSSESDHV